MVKSLYDLDEDELRELILEYNRYIQEANDEDKYNQGWKPVCIGEFLNNEFIEILEGVR